MDTRITFVTLAVADHDGFRREIAYNPGPLGVELMAAAGLV